MIHLARRLTLLLLLLFTATTLVTAHSSVLEKDFRQLDAAIAKRDQYIKKRQAEINAAKMALGEYTSYDALFKYNQRLFNEYMKFNSDSALAYAKRCMRVASSGRMTQQLALARCMNIMALVSRGDRAKAADSLDAMGPISQYRGIVRENLALAHLEYNARYVARFTDMGLLVRSSVADSLWKPYLQYLPRNGWQACYYAAQFTRDASLIPQLQRFLLQLKRPSPQTAMLGIALSCCLAEKKEGEEACHYLIQSALDDVQCCIHDAASLLYVLRQPYLDKASRRAAVYARVCSENINTYKDSARSLMMVRIHSSIAEGYERKMEITNGLLLAVIVLLIGAVLTALGMVWSIRKRDRKQKRMLVAMKGMNNQLREMIDNEKAMQEQLRESNQRLSEEIEQRNRNFMDVYMLVTKYINDVKAFNKVVFNLITAGKVDKARRELAAGGNTDKYLTDFYHHFDVAFLSSHPDFLERLNTLMLPECQQQLAAPQTFTPEQRIYALVSIGITDVPSIAAFLHYSIQTVYNYRQRMSRGARLQARQLAEAVAQFYHSEGDASMPASEAIS